MRNRTLLFCFLLGSAIFLANKSAMATDAYTRMQWFDVPMHFLGGMFVLFGVVGFLFQRLAAIGSPFQRILTALLLVLAVGLLWEAFEYFLLYRFFDGPKPGTEADFYADLFLDLFGAAVGLLFIRFKKNKVQ